ncbi:hypothetical protein [Pleurocapsa sp. CCALA 161]|uniref:hypothetical protein n=1 Tax=Pleurocapsa sp. CCALA 161 TaxID=2107688 RepID=UPI0018ECB470|nr:hypothetical protein [Pleurocapsa sp. CCALA 161]
MKVKTSQKYNLSLQLVTFMAAVFSLVFYTAIAQAQTRKESLVTSQTPSLFSQPQQLITQTWSDLDSDREAYPKGNRLSLATPNQQPEIESETLLINQLNLEQQQLIAQTWSDLDSNPLSLATPNQQPEIESETLLINQLNLEQQQLIAQTWSDLDSDREAYPKGNRLSVATPNQQPEIESETLLINQLNLEQQQLIAQTWSDLDSDREAYPKGNRLSVATPNQQPEIESETLLINQLNLEQQQLIAQTWSDLDSDREAYPKGNRLSLATPNPQPQISNTSVESQSLLINQLNPQQQQLIAQTWSELDAEQLSLANPDDWRIIIPDAKKDREATPQSEPIINPPDKREIATRLTLKQVQIISPAPGVILSSHNNDSVTIQYPPTASVKLQVNGAELADSAITQQSLDSKRNLITQTWQGAELKKGTNTLSVIASQDGIKTKTDRQVMVKDVSRSANAVKKSATTTENNAQQPVNPEITPPSPTESPVKILTPAANATLETIHSSVIIQYPESTSVILQVNGKSVDTAQVGRTELHPVSHVVTQTWYGVIFKTGVNTLSILSTTDGVKYIETAIKITVPGRPEALQVETVETEIPADGQAIATVQGRYVDGQGTTTPWNEIVTLNSSAGKFVGTDVDPDRPGFQVKPEKGEFTASLQAGYDAKTVRIQAKARQLEAYTQTQFKTTLREKPLLTGFADLRIGAGGINYYDSLRDFLPLDHNNGAEIDFSSAAFITGSFGKWSYTGAFNSDRPLNEDKDGETRIFRTYDQSESNYPVYGDSSTTEATTPSTDSLYLRLERSPRIEFADPDYFMWGDYDTEEFSTESQEFSGISRQLHGFKANYNLGDFQFNALYANSVEGFQRDAIAPDGTSGFYFFSRRLLIPGSEDIYLELSPLNDPGKVVTRQRLSLGLDYEIDYDRGTLLFKDPVLRTQVNQNGNILVRRIIATYQFEVEANEASLVGARGRYHFNRDLETPSWIGASYLNEDRGDQDFSLWGVDGYFSLGEWGKLIAEYAQSDNQTVFAEADGSAYRFEGEVKFNDYLQGRVYYRDIDEGFANNATLSFVPGQITYGSQIEAQIARHTKLQFSYEHQDNKGVSPRPLDELAEFLDSGFDPVPGNQQDNSLSTITAGVEQKIGKADLGIDLTWRDRTDRKSPGALNSTSTQLRSRFSIPIIDKLNFQAFNEITLSDNTDAVFSDRTGLGLDWEFYKGLSLVLNQQWFTRGELAGESLTSFGIQGEYEPWANATLTGRYSLTNGISGVSNIGAIGLQQKITIAPGLNLDLDYEHTFSGFDTIGSGIQYAQPFAVGQGSSSLGFSSGSTYSIGIEYTDNPDFTASAKWQHSDNSGGGNTVITADVTGKLSSSLTSLFSYNQASSANQTFDIGTTRNIRLGLAYRNPKQDNFNALLRYEYEENGGTIPETLLLGKGTGSQEHLFGIEAIYAPNWRWEFYGKYAFRNSKTFLADDFVGSSNISLGQLRATYRLNYHIDLAVEGRTIWQPSAGYTESGFVLEAGYYLTPELRISTGYVFGSADDEDFTGTRSAGGAYVGVTMKLNSLLDGFGQHQPPSPPEVIPKKK